MKSKRVDSKAKGNTFELAVSKALTTALAPLRFVRSPGSGARVGGTNFNRFGGLYSADTLNIFVGDVVCVNESEVGLTFKCNVECKSYKESDSITSLISGKSKIYEWMIESEIDAAKTNKVAVVIFKFNRTPTFIASTELPESCVKIVLKREDGGDIRIGFLDDVLKVREFWVGSTSGNSQKVG